MGDMKSKVSSSETTVLRGRGQLVSYECQPDTTPTENRIGERGWERLTIQWTGPHISDLLSLLESNTEWFFRLTATEIESKQASR